MNDEMGVMNVSTRATNSSEVVPTMASMVL